MFKFWDFSDSEKAAKTVKITFCHTLYNAGEKCLKSLQTTDKNIVSYTWKLFWAESGLCRTIFWAEAGVIKSSRDDGSNIMVVAKELGNITAIDIAHGNFVDIFFMTTNWL